MKTKSTVIIASILAIAVIVIAFKYPELFSEEKVEKSEQKAAVVKAANVKGIVLKPEKYENKILATGTVIPNERVELRSEVTGRITGIYFKEDSPVKKGQLLVKIYDKDLKAQLRKVKVQQKLAEEDAGRKKQLLEIKGVSKEAYDQAVSTVNTLKAEADLLEAQLARTEVRAPFNGVIGLRNISEGGYVSASDLIATMQDINPVKVEFSVPEKYAHIVKKGSQINFTAGGSNRSYTGKVYAAATEIDLQTRSLKVRALAKNEDFSLTPGAFVQVKFNLETLDSALFIPAEALIPELGGQKVFVSRGNVARAIPVETGIRTEREIQIVHGLVPTDTVLITGLLQVKDNKEVNVTEILEKESLNLTVNSN